MTKAKKARGDKKINNILLTDNTGIFSDVLQQLLVGDGFVALSNIDRDVLIKNLKKLSDCEEMTNPSMLPILDLFLVRLPSEAIDILDSYPSSNNMPTFDLFYDFYWNMQQWIRLPENIDLLLGLNKTISEQAHKYNEIQYLQQIERNFIEEAGGKYKNKEKMRRLKILSARQAHIFFCSIKEFLEKCRQSDELRLRQDDPCLMDVVRSTMRLTTFAIRSMIQFSACYVAHDGINRQQGRKNQPDADKKGLEELTKSIIASHPRASQPELWNAVRRKLNKEKVFEFEDYTVEFRQDPADYRKVPGTLFQKDISGKEYPIGFSAFKNIVSNLKKNAAD